MRSYPFNRTTHRFFPFLMLVFLLMGCASPAQAAVQTTSPLPTSMPTDDQLPTPTTDGAGAQRPCEQSGTIQSFNLSSALLNDTLSFNIYFPPCYDPHATTPYPVIYLLHGQEQDASLWQDLDIQAAADDLVLNHTRQPFLIVMPVERYYFRAPENNRFPDAILEELLPWVETHLPACAQKECRAIGGISRGAAWAVRLALQNWDVFGALGAHSTPLFDGDLESLPGWLDAIPLADLPRMYVDVGSTDPAVKDASAFEQTLNSLGIPHEWHLNSGRHNESYWAEQLPAYLAWYTLPWMEESD